MADEDAARSYRSPLRERAAQQTKKAILAAAYKLFVAQGFGATSVDAIAEAAGVSKPTVFSTVGNKAMVFKEVRDIAMAGDDEPIPVLQRPAYLDLIAEPDPYRTVLLLARNTTALLNRYAEIDEVLHGAADSDPDLRKLWATSETQRLRAAGFYIDNLTGKGPLKPGLDTVVATDLLWLLIAPTHYHRLVHACRWSPAQFEEWLGDALVYQLLPPRLDRTNPEPKEKNR